MKKQRKEIFVTADEGDPRDYAFLEQFQLFLRPLAFVVGCRMART